MNLLLLNRARFSREVAAATVTCLVLFGVYARAGEELAVTNAADPSAALQLRSAVQVDGEGVFLDQVIESKSDLQRLRLCDAPACGKSLLLKRPELSELARAAGMDNGLTNWVGSEAIRVSRRLRPLAEKEGLQLLTSVLQRQYIKEQGELELRLSRPWAVINVPDEPFTVKVTDLPISGVAPAFIIRFELETARGEHFGSWQAALQTKVWREVWVARSPLKRGDSVRGADLTRERRDVLLLREALAEFAPDGPTLEFAEAVQPGVPLLARLIRARAIVHRGQSIAAMVQDGSLMITLKVEALEDGAAGQMIRVRNPLSLRDLHGRVVDEQNILVSL
jgi:flagella basal body P-ring formation protein FlgA